MTRGTPSSKRPASARPTRARRNVGPTTTPGVQALRDHLRAHNGLPGLEIVEPHEVERATRIFFRDGFVVVRDVLDADRLRDLRVASARMLERILEIPGVGGRKYVTETARLPHRYSYGTASASRQLLHEPEWAALIDLPTTTPILKSLFGGPDYQVTGAGGDLCLPGAIEYQTLHADFRERFELPEARLAQARRVGVRPRTDDGELDHSARQLIFERTPPRVTINVLMSDLTWENGPIRQIPGTQARPGNPPSQADEPEWMRLSTLVGAPGRRRHLPRPTRLARRHPERRQGDPRHAERGIRLVLARRPLLQPLHAPRGVGDP